MIRLAEVSHEYRSLWRPGPSVRALDAVAQLGSNRATARGAIGGEGAIEDLATGEVHEIGPGVMYALDKHDKHVLRARSEMVMACCFNPPVTGKEVHGPDGAYALEVEEVA